MITPDLSGHGDSEHRSDYSAAQWVRELKALIQYTGSTPVTLIGHSAGGKLGLLLATDATPFLKRIILIDCAVISKQPRSNPRPALRTAQKKFYPTQEAAIAHFSLRPPATTAPKAVLQLLARQSVIRVAEGWTWKTDPKVMQGFARTQVKSALSKVGSPVGFIRGARSSVVEKDTLDYLSSHIPQPFAATTVHGAYHHVQLDAPQACVRAIDYLIDLLPY